MYLIHSSELDFFLRIERGEDLVKSVHTFCQSNKIHAGWVQGLGACDQVTVSYYDLEAQQYKQESFEEEFEVLNLTGNISLLDEKPFMHAHVSLGRKDKSVIGGHLHSMRISGTGEIYIKSFDNSFVREKDEETGLSLLKGSTE